jgi:hypothetical protein
MHEDYDGGVDRGKRAGGIIRVLEKLKYPVFGHICTSDAIVESEGRAVMLSIRHLALEPSFPYLYRSVGDLLQTRAALPWSHLHLQLPSARVNLAPTLLVSVPSDTEYFKPGRLFDEIYRF